MEAQRAVMGAMMASPPTPHTTSHGPIWSLDETVNLGALCGEAEVLCQFAQGGHSNTNAYVYEGLSGCMWERRHK